MFKTKRPTLAKLTISTHSKINLKVQVSAQTTLSEIKVASISNTESSNKVADQSKNNNLFGSAYQHGPIEIIPGLFLGTQKDAANLTNLESLKIDSILNLAEEINSCPNSPNDITAPRLKYLHFGWCHNEQNINKDFDKAFNFIDQARYKRKTGILLHCQLGVSRSATLVLAYLMKTFHCSSSFAYSFLKSKSPRVSPNIHLFSQLIIFESFLKDSQQKPFRDLNSPLNLLMPSINSSKISSKRSFSFQI